MVVGGSGTDFAFCDSVRFQLVPLCAVKNLIRPLAKQSRLDDDNRVRDKMKIYFTLSWWSLALARQIDSHGDMESAPIGEHAVAPGAGRLLWLRKKKRWRRPCGITCNLSICYRSNYCDQWQWPNCQRLVSAV